MLTRILTLGTTLSRLHRDDEAMAAFRTVLAAEPGHPEAHCGVGTLLDRQRRHAEAIEHYRAALARNPNHVDAMAGLATAMKNLGQHARGAGAGASGGCAATELRICRRPARIHSR